MPIMIASLCARRRCTRSRTRSPVIASGRRPAAPALPSAETASLSMTCGRPSRMRRMWPAWSRRASSAPTPTSTAMPAARSRAWPCAGDLRIGIFERRDHARDAGGDDGVGAGRRFAVMRARLERHVERGAAGRLAGAARAPRSRHAAGRRACVQPRPTMTPLFDDHRADGRIGPGAPEPAPAQGERQRHEADILRGGGLLKAHGRDYAHGRLPVSRTSLICARRSDLRSLICRQFGERRLEILGLAEIAIDRGEAHIGDIVEVAQIGHHRLADRLRRNLAFALAFELAHDLRDHLVDRARARPAACAARSAPSAAACRGRTARGGRCA